MIFGHIFISGLLFWSAYLMAYGCALSWKPFRASVRIISLFVIQGPFILRQESWHSDPLSHGRQPEIWSSDDTFNLRSNHIMQYLNKRGCNLSFLKRRNTTLYNAIQLRLRPPCGKRDIIKPSLNSTYRSSRVPFVVTCNPAHSFFPIYHKKALSHSPFLQTMYQNIHITTPYCFQTF